MIQYNIQHCKTFNEHSFWNDIEPYFKAGDTFLVACNIWTERHAYNNLVNIMANHAKLLTTVEYLNADESIDVVKLYLQTTDRNSYRYIVHMYNIEQNKFHIYFHNPLKSPK